MTELENTGQKVEVSKVGVPQTPHVPKIFLSREEAKEVINIFLLLDKVKEVSSNRLYQRLKQIITERNVSLGMRIFIVIGRVMRKAKDSFSDTNPRYYKNTFYILEMDTGEQVYVAKHWLIDKNDWEKVSSIETGMVFKAECYPWGQAKGKPKYRLARVLEYLGSRRYDYGKEQ